ncbi:NAD/NADP octopine/nopaline dehydrogenase family protein [Clostridium sp.]|uniref:NAD/NADP-dependent octopine/nopaline dehydrogenase family protein n=1 Tax=Clostridium sp. TaxID=1506 RepID=UPI001A41C1F7|nr:NAD/NADP octopine/nopaline dehydrogenase family protein [Clostridium sp.]MBK5239893.1 NAD/NADP octopine/nopaline dehydrogenase family protein [Clostridium sp.]
MKATVIGAGNIGMATGAYLSELGCDITVYTRDERKAVKLRSEGLYSEGKIEGHFNLNAYSNYKDALADAEYILITTLANNHLDVFKAIKPYLEKGQKIIIFNGNWGAFEAKEYYKNFLKDNEIIVAETGAMLFMAKAYEIGKVNILGIKKQITISTINSNDVDIVLNDLKNIFPQFKKVSSIYETSISTTNPVIHVPLTIFNLARIEEGQDFSFYGEGVSKSEIAYIEGIDKERISIAERIGFTCPSILESINSFFDIKYDNLYDALNKNEIYIKGKAPTSLSHRYITEDIPYGIVPIVKLGKVLGIDTKYSEALVKLAGLVLNINFLEAGVSIFKENIIS